MLNLSANHKKYSQDPLDEILVDLTDDENEDAKVSDESNNIGNVFITANLGQAQSLHVFQQLTRLRIFKLTNRLDMTSVFGSIAGKLARSWLLIKSCKRKLDNS